MNIFRRLYFRLSRAGATDDLDPHLCQKIVLTNQLVLAVLLILGVTWFVLGSILDVSDLLPVVMIVACLFYVASIALNHFRCYDLARLLFTFLPPVAITVMAGLVTDGPVVALKFALFSVILVPVMLFGLREPVKMAIGIGWVAAVFFSIDHLTFLIPRQPDIDARLADSPLSVNMNALLSFALFVLAFIYSQRLTLDAEARLAAKTELAEKARQAADAASQARSQFLANMSHEIRTPMNAIIGLTNIVLMTELTETQRSHLTKVRSSSNWLLGIVNDILDLAKIEASGLSIEQVSFNLDEVLASVSDILAVRAEQKGLQLIFQTADDVPRSLRGDPMRLEQVLGNLGDNAIKFTEAGQVTVTTTKLLATSSSASAGDGDDKKVTLRFSVRDTGVGIPAELRDELFKPFTQADSTVARRFGGTGLGLTICSRVVELMGGRIEVQSEVGGGSEFSFTAQFERSSSQPVQSRGSAAKADWGGEALTGRAGASVLLAEDNELNQQVAIELLKMAGIETVVATTGTSAVALAEAQDFDLVLMDIEMPEMDGYEACERIRAVDARTPIVAVTAHAMAGERDRCLAAGMNDYLTKPISQKALYDVLRRWLPERQTSAEPPAARRRRASSLVDPEPLFPPCLSYLDLAAARQRIGGSPTLLRRLITMFQVNNQCLSSRLSEAWERKDLPDLALMAHTLVGAAGNIGADKLSALSASLEEAARNGDESEIPTQLEAAIGELTEVLSRIRRSGIVDQAGENTVGGEASSIDRAEVPRLFDELMQALAENRLDARRLVDRLRAAVSEEPLGEQVVEVVALVEALQYAEARQRLQAIEDQLTKGRD